MTIATLTAITVAVCYAYLGLALRLDFYVHLVDENEAKARAGIWVLAGLFLIPFLLESVLFVVVLVLGVKQLLLRRAGSLG